MIALVLAATLAVPCRAALASTEKTYTCVEYAEGNGVVVYALEQLPPHESDFQHKVFVALFRKTVVDRVDVTQRMLDMGDHDGTFAEMSAAVRPFVLGGKAVVDIELASTLSGSGGITKGSDLILQIGNRHLHEIAFLEGTFGGARGGWGYYDETDSQIFAGSRELLWTRRARKGTSKRADDPLIVHCKVDRHLYRYASGKLERTTSAREKGMRLISGPKARQFLPCCAGCEFRAIH